MIKNKITYWVPLITVIICGLLIAGVVVAQPGGGGGGRGGTGPGQGPMGQGPGQGNFGPRGMGGGDHAMMLLGPGGPFADEEIHNLMFEIKTLGFINKLDLSADQLEQVAILSGEARNATRDIAEEAKDLVLDRLYERRDSLLKGEKPGEMKRPEKGEMRDDMKAQAEETKGILGGITEDFINLLTDDQLRALKQGPRQGGFGQGPGGGQGMSQGQFKGDKQEWGRKPRAEMPGELDKQEIDIPDGLTPEELRDRKLRDGQRGDRQGGRTGQHQGFQGGGGQGFGGGMQGNPEMMLRMQIIEILLNPQTVNIIEMKLDYL